MKKVPYALLIKNVSGKITIEYHETLSYPEHEFNTKEQIDQWAAGLKTTYMADGEWDKLARFALRTNAFNIFQIDRGIRVYWIGIENGLAYFIFDSEYYKKYNHVMIGAKGRGTSSFNYNDNHEGVENNDLPDWNFGSCNEERPGFDK